MHMQNNPTIVVEVPRAKRISKALLTLAVTLAVTIWAFATLYSESNLTVQSAVWLLPFWALGVFQSYRYWAKSHVQELTPEAKQRQLSAQRKTAEWENKWYVRYPMAAGALCLAWHVLSPKPDSWWAAAALGLLALFWAREVGVVLIAFGAGYLILKGIASLPVSAAIIIGALIIASAIKR